MKEEHINRVIELYKNREDVEKEAHVASFEEIEENGFNLNIPRYVDTSEEEEEIDLKQLTAEIKETNKAIKEANESFLNMMNDLTFNTPETKEAVSEFIQILKEM